MRAVHRTDGDPMSNIASRTFLRIQVIVVLGYRRLEHGRSEIRSIFQRFGERIVGQETQSVCVTPTHVHVACVIPALSRVFEQIDGADREGGAGNRDVRWEHRIGNKAYLRKWAARLDEARTRQCVIDEMCALQME